MTDADRHDQAREHPDVRHEREVMAFVNGETDAHPFGDVPATPPQERARCQRCGNVVRLVTESHIVGGVDEDGEGEECDGSDSDEWEATDALPPQQAANEGGDRCAEMRRRGDAISALCWALRQGADPVETAQKIGGHAANIAVHYGLPAPSVATPGELRARGELAGVADLLNDVSMSDDLAAQGAAINALSLRVRAHRCASAAQVAAPTEELRACCGICDHVDCLP